MPVDTIRDDVKAISSQWKRLRDCSAGRDAILKAAEQYVPDLPGADKNANIAYRARGNFYNALGRTVEGMNGALFQEAPEVDITDTFKAMLDDITLTSIPFETFAAEAGEEVFLVGRYGVLVDIDDTTNPTNRPYCVGYEAESIINWRVERRSGQEMLTMLVLQESAELPYDAADPFVCKTVVQYRVLTLTPEGKCVRELWRAKTDDQSQFEVFGEAVPLMRRGDALTFIPFIFFNALSPTPDLEAPPLLDLADVNLGHWRNSVDHEYGLHLVALPTPWVAGAKGASDSNVDKKIGPSVVWELDVNGSAGMLEFAGTGLGAIVTAMEDKKKMMAALGARLLEDAASVAETAMAVKMRHAGETATLKTIAQSLEQGLTLLLQIVVWWAGTDEKPLDAEVSVEINKEFTNVRATPQEIQAALTALQAGEISFETWYNLLQIGGWTREGIDAAKEREDIASDKALEPEPAIDPTLSPSDVVPPVVPPTRIVKDGQGNVKYQITG